MIDVDDEDLRVMLIESFRYALGRQSYAPPDTMDRIRLYRFALLQSDVAIMVRDIRTAIERAKAGYPYAAQWMRLADELDPTLTAGGGGTDDNR